MQEFATRHPRLARKEQELQKLFDEANRRRKSLLNTNDTKNNSIKRRSRSQNPYLLKPLRSVEEICKDNINITVKDQLKDDYKNNLSNQTSYLSYQNLPETNLDEFSLNKVSSNGHPSSNNQISAISSNINDSSSNFSGTNVTSSFDMNQDNNGQINPPGHLNPNFANSSSSSSNNNNHDDVDNDLMDSKYCEFYPLSTGNSITTTTVVTTAESTISTTNTNTTTSNTKSSLLTSSDQDYNDKIMKKNTNNNENDENDAVDGSQRRRRRSSVFCYPSGSPLISPKYQGSPVVRIDNKIRAGEAEYLVDCQDVPPKGKPPLMPNQSRLVKPSSAGVTRLFGSTPNNRLSQPNLSIENGSIHGDDDDDDEDDEEEEQEEEDHLFKNDRGNEAIIDEPPNALGNRNRNYNSSVNWIRKRNKRLLEQQLTKRFSMGDYSTRSLIEWENKMQMDSNNAHNLSISGELNVRKSVARRQLSSTDSDVLYERETYSSETNMVLGCLSNESQDSVTMAADDNLKHSGISQVSFIIHNDKSNKLYKSSSKQHLHDDNCRISTKSTSSKGWMGSSGFLQRSLNDIRGAVRNWTTNHSNCERAYQSSRHKSNHSFYTNKISAFPFRSFKKRESITSDQLYSIPPFVRRHLPPDISGAPTTSQQSGISPTISPLPITTNSDSTPNLIAQLDPTFTPNLNSPTQNGTNAIPMTAGTTKRNRSYRLSFIENADTVATRKLTTPTSPHHPQGYTNNNNTQKYPYTTSPISSNYYHNNNNNSNNQNNNMVPRYVQPKRRSHPKDSHMSGGKRKVKPPYQRSRSTNRTSCIQQ